MNDDELKRHIHNLAKEHKVIQARCLGSHCDRREEQDQRQTNVYLLNVELERLRHTINSLKVERDALNAILSRLVEENDALEAKLPFNVARRWITFIRGGWRV